MLPIAYRLDKNKDIIPLSREEVTSGELEKVILDFNSRIVRQTSIKNYWISTVFLAVDHGGRYLTDDVESYQPLLFETMIQKDDEWMGYQDRYYSYKDALKGHREAVRMIIKEVRNE